jgi:hypothetical protein
MEPMPNITREEVQMMIDEAVEHKIRQLLQEWFPDISTSEKDTRTLAEILEDADRNRWTPPPGSPSAVELLREDRDNDELYR